MKVKAKITTNHGTFEGYFDFETGIFSDLVEVAKRKKGKWIDRGKDYVLRWVCSECGRKDMHIYNYCPDCGADMREEKEGLRVASFDESIAMEDNDGRSI